MTNLPRFDPSFELKVDDKRRLTGLGILIVRMIKMADIINDFL
jgi:hypothetical protein